MKIQQMKIIKIKLLIKKIKTDFSLFIINHFKNVLKNLMKDINQNIYLNLLLNQFLDKLLL